MPTTLRDVPPQLLKDIKAWARLRSMTDEEAVVELLKIALDVTSERNQAVIRQALDTIEDIRRRGRVN